MANTTRIAFLGLGSMGSPMVRRVLNAGYPLTVWNRSPGRAEQLAAEGARRADTPAEAVTDADVVITMLADPPAVHAVVAEIAPALRPGTHLIEASTIGPMALSDVATLLPEHVTLIDAPVMGSADRAEAGELTLLVGGQAEPVLPVLELFGTVTRTGATGTGAALKIVLINAVVAGVTAIGEAMVLADRFGLPEDLVKNAMAASPVAGVASRAFAQTAHFPLRLAAKDVSLALASADLPLTKVIYERLTAHPEAAEDDLGKIVDLLR